MTDEYRHLTDIVDQTIADKPWPDAQPLPDVALPTPAPFPFDGLGVTLGAAGRSIATDVQAPDALAGASVLAAAALAVQAHADVLLPHGQRAPLSIYAITGATSGERKSATDAVACRPIEEFRRNQAAHHAAALRAHDADRSSRQRSSIDSIRPTASSLTIGKATVEGLHMMLRSQSHVGLFTAEGGELLGGHSMRAENKAAGLAWFLKAWSGETLDALTRGDGLSLLPGRRVTLHALMQPVLLCTLLADPLAQGQGFLARCLISQPASLAGTRTYKDVNPMLAPPVIAFHRSITSLLSMPPPIAIDGDGYELAPRSLTLSLEAKARWIHFYNEVEAAQAQGAALMGARAFASKAAEQAARIAGIVQLLENRAAEVIEADEMSGAIEVASYYVSEHVRLTGVGIEDVGQARLRALLAWLEALRSREAPVSMTTILQRSPRALRLLGAKGLRPLLDELASLGHIRLCGSAWEVRP